MLVGSALDEDRDREVLAQAARLTEAARLPERGRHDPRRMGPDDIGANMRALQAYAWPGNARELQNVVERAAILARDGKLHVDLPAGDGTLAEAGERAPAAVPGRVLDAAEMRAFERGNLVRALAACDGRVAGERGAAVLLGLRPSTLSSRMKALGVARS